MRAGCGALSGGGARRWVVLDGPVRDEWTAALHPAVEAEARVLCMADG